MEHMPIEWIMEVPPITRMWSLSIVILSGLEHFGVLNKLDFYYSFDAVFKKHQYYRLLTSFLYSGDLSVHLIITLYRTMRCLRNIEEKFFKKKDFVWFLFVICSMILIYSSFISDLYLLGSYFNDVLLFLWCRENSGVQVFFLGLIRIQAIYLQFFFLGLDLLLKEEGGISRYLVGIIVGHTYNFLNESFPKLHDGMNPVKPIWYWFRNNSAEDDQPYVIDPNGAGDGGIIVF